MRLVIISDTHDNLPWLDKVLQWLKTVAVDGLVHCGDVQTNATLKYLCDNFSAPIWVVSDERDNLDDYVNHRLSWPANLKAIHHLIELPDIGLAAVHRSEAVKALVDSGKYKYICHGHTHLPWDQRHGQTRVFNPGNLCNVRARPSFATLDTQTDDLQLHIVENL